MKKKVTELLVRAFVFIVSAVSFVVMYCTWSGNGLSTPCGNLACCRGWWASPTVGRSPLS